MGTRSHARGPVAGAFGDRMKRGPPQVVRRVPSQSNAFSAEQISHLKRLGLGQKTSAQLDLPLRQMANQVLEEIANRIERVLDAQIRRGEHHDFDLVEISNLIRPEWRRRRSKELE